MEDIKILNNMRKNSVIEYPLKKHKHVYILYGLLIKHIGDNARYLARNKIYKDVARFFYINSLMVGRIVTDLEKKKYKPTDADKQEFLDSIKSLAQITKIDNTLHKTELMRELIGLLKEEQKKS